MNTVDHGEHVGAMRIEVEINQNKWELDKVTLQLNTQFVNVSL